MTIALAKVRNTMNGPYPAAVSDHLQDIADLLRQIADKSLFSDTDIESELGLDAGTVSNWRSGRQGSTGEQQQIIRDLVTLILRLSQYYWPDAIRLWLTEPHPQLDGERAIAVVAGGRTPEALNILDRLDHGAYL